MKPKDYIMSFIWAINISALLLFIINTASANYAPKAQVEKCILLSVDKLVVPNEAAMTVSPSCLEAPCFAIPDGFSCIYYKVVGDTLEVDATKKLNYENALKDVQVVKTDFEDAQTLSDIRNYCIYVYGLQCTPLDGPKKTEVRKALNILYPKGVKPAILLKQGL